MHVYDMVQAPVVVQGLYTELLSPTRPKVLFAPWKAVKVRGIFTVSVVPLVETETPAALSVHWLLEREPDPPGEIGPW